MAFSEITRLHYLNAMGITVWQPRLVTPSFTTLFTEPIFSEPALPENLISDSWEQLRHDVTQCQACTLCTTRMQTVFGEGNPHAKWLFIAEPPGQPEDMQGRPFGGEAGQLLSQM